MLRSSIRMAGASMNAGSEEEGSSSSSDQPGQQQAAAMQPALLQGSSSSSTDVKVVVRVRPPTLDLELQSGVHNCVAVEGHNKCTVSAPHETVSMSFNWVAGPATTQAEFFRVVGQPTVENCLLGFNSSIFAYGQTGSGKTHTMIGDLPAEDASSLPHNAGIIPRIFKYLWHRMPEVQADMLANPRSSSVGAGNATLSSSPAAVESAAEQGSYKWLVRCSMLEIHKEDVFDLLQPGSGALTIREDIRRGVYVEGLCERVVENVPDALDVLRAGTANRQVAANDLNAASSRSHCIFTCHIESRLEPQAGMVNVRSSRLHLVDLAGSERLKSSWASAYAAGANTGRSVHSSWDGGNSVSGGGGGGTRLRETTSINSSLTVLGLVILRLTEQQPHIPYRNSKLTFLLQDSIGGNAKTVIIANVSPSEACLQETLSTLGFAARARKIVNKAVVNEEHGDDVTLLRQKIKRLQQELVLARAVAAKASCSLRLSSNSSSTHMAASEAAQAAAQEAAQQLQDQQQQLEDALQLLSELGDRNSELEQAAEFYQRERDALEQNCLEARAELAAMQVSLQQALSDNKGKKHGGGFFRKADKAGKAAQAAQQHQQQDQASSPAGSPAAGAASAADANAGGSSSTGKGKQQSSPGWLSGILGGSRKDKAAKGAAVAGHKADMQQQQGEQCRQQLDHAQQLQQQVLQLVSTQLLELTASICPSSAQPGAAATAATGADAPAATAAAGSGVTLVQGVGLQELQELTRQHDSLPELQGIVGALRTLVAWRQQQQQQQEEASVQQPGAGAAPGKAGSSGKVAPSELHRQLFEERELTSQLQARIRQLQQELLLAGGPAVAATVPLPTCASVTPAPGGKQHVSTGARLARLSPGVGVHYSADAACVRALHVAPAALESAFAEVSEAGALRQPAAVAVEPPAGGAADLEGADVLQGSPCCLAPEGQETLAFGGPHAEEPVMVQVSINAAHNSSKAAEQEQQKQPNEAAAAAAAAAATIAEQRQVIEGLQAQLTELQERLEASQREQLSFNSKWQSLKALVAAARCSTPSSQLSSSLTSPQPSFGPLEPVFGSSIIEEPELDESDQGDDELEPTDAAPGGSSAAACDADADSIGLASSLSKWALHPEPEAASSPCTSPSRRAEGEAAAAAAMQASSLAGGPHAAAPGLEEEMSEAEVWQRHHSQVQHHQLEYERKAQLTKAVHAAIAYGKQLGYRPFSPTDPTHNAQQQQAEQQAVTLPTRQEQQDRDQQQQHDLSVVSLQDETSQAGQQQDDQQQQPASVCQLQCAPGEGDADGLGTAHSSSSGSSSHTTRSSGSTRGSYSDLAEQEAAGAGVLQLGADPPIPQQEAAAGGAGAAAEAGQDCNEGAAVVAAAAAAAAEQQPCDEVGEERWRGAPAWGVSDYEEEVRQLSDQLQSMVAANSSLKAVLQQRDAELAAQRELLQQQSELLQQQSHDLACSEQMLEELQARLAHSEAAAAAYATEHCDAVWLKGQYEGLKGLNAFLQEQLAEQGELLRLQGEELQEMREQQLSADRSCQEGSKADQQAAKDAQQMNAAAPDAGAEEQQSAAAATPCAAADASTQTPGAEGAPAPIDGGPTQPPAVCVTPGAVAGELQATVAPASCSTPGSKRRRHVQGGRERTPPRMGGAAEARQPMSPFRQLRVHTHALRAEPHNMQVAAEQRTLLQQQIAAMGLVMQQRHLEQQLEAVKQQLQEVQKGQENTSSSGGADVVVSRLGSPAHPDQCCSPVLDLQQQGQSPAAWATLPVKQSRLAQGGGGSCSSPQAAAAAAQTWLAAARSSAAFLQHWTPGDDSPAAASQQRQEEAPATTTSPEAASSRKRVAEGGSSSSTGSSAASTPRSSGASSSGDSCTDLLNELSDFAEEVQKLATAAHQASTFKAVSASTLFPLRSSQQQLLGAAASVPDAPAQQVRVSVAGSVAVSSVGSPCALPQQQQQQQQGALLCSSPDKLDGGALLDAAAALESDATAKLQADLQVSSAYELAATRGLLHAGAVLRELRSTLGSSKHSAQHKHSKHHGTASTAGRLKSASRVATLVRSPGAEQRQQGGESPPVARTLFATAFEGADTDARTAPAAAAVSGPAGAADAAASDSSPGPQHSAFGVLRQLQQQQQYIIEVLGSLAATQQLQQQQQQGLSTGGSPAPNPLQQLADAEQQLQVLLHAVGAVVQDAHASIGGNSPAGGAFDGRQQLADLVGPRGPWPGWSQPASLRGSAIWAMAAAAAGGTPDAPKLAADRQLLQGGSPDQQQQRDSSPDKLRRRQHAWVLPGAAPCLAGEQQPTLTCAGAAGVQEQQQQQQHGQLEVEQQQVQELTQLRGQVIRLQLELQRAKQQAHVAESLVSASCTSLPGGGRRSISPDHAGWLRRSQDSVVSTPAGATSGVTSAATGASGGSAAAGTPAQLVLLSGRNRELQAVCMQRDSQVRQLENEVRRLQHELRQQALAAAYPAGGGSVPAGGLLTPRGAGTPRHAGLGGITGPPGLFSSLSPQRRAASSPGAAAGTPRGFSSSGGGGGVAAAAGYAVQVPALGGYAAAGHMPPTRFASGSGGAGQADAHLPAVPECMAQRRQQQQDDDVSCASTSSSRSRGKGIKVGAGKPPLHVPSLKRK